MRLVLAVVLVATIGCRASAGASNSTAPATTAATPAEPPIAVGGSAVVRPGATVWLDAGDTRPLQLPATLAAGGVAVRVIGTSGDRVEVETDTETPCLQQPLRELRLRMFAARSDLHEGALACPAPRDADKPAATQPPAANTSQIVRGGAQIFWRNGTPAGTVARDYAFATPPTVAGPRTCFPLALAPGDEITLCFPSEALAVVEAPRLLERSPNMLGGGDADLGGFGGLGRGAAVDKVQVRMAKALVKGPLDRDIVRRIMRAHLNEIRFCYRKALERNAAIKGRVAVRFTIAATGDVIEAHIAETSTGDAELEQCMVERVTQWKFPKPEGGGTVEVTHPFLLEPG